MRGIKGTFKKYGDHCADCKVVLDSRNAVHRRPPRQGLLSYCRRCMNERAGRARKRDPDAAKAVQRRYRAEIRQQVLAAYGGKCACCGEITPEFLALDHVHGGGTKERREKCNNTSTSMYRRARALGYPPQYQLLCHNCNCAKGWYGICPHQRS